MFGQPWWYTIFFALGVLATVGVVVTLFFSLGRRPQRYSATSTPSVDSEEFLVGIAGSMNAPLRRGGTAQLLNNGVEIFPAILQAIREAHHNVNFMAYIWEPGKVSDALIEVLCERARAGVEVRVMLDGMGGMYSPDEKIQELRDAGGKVEWFRQLRFGKLTRFHKRNHRRAIVVDGRVAFTGGAAVGDKWLGNADSVEHWRDMMVEVRGPLALNLQSAFTQLWAEVGGELLIGPTFYPTSEETEPGEGDHLSRHINVISSPASEAHPIRKLFWLTFACAREKLYITSPYFVPDDDTRKVIAARARAGVDVRILLPNHLIDARPIRWASHSYYQPLLEAGVRIYEFQPTMLHSKTLVVDSVWSIVGSANMDIRSKELNQENVIAILDRSFGKQIEDAFLADLPRAREILLDEWRRRGLGARVLERFCVLFAEQY